MTRQAFVNINVTFCRGSRPGVFDTLRPELSFAIAARRSTFLPNVGSRRESASTVCPFKGDPMSRRSLILALAVFGGLTTASRAADAPGKVSGVVTDAADKPVAGASVRIMSAGMGRQTLPKENSIYGIGIDVLNLQMGRGMIAIAVTKTDANGMFSFPAVKPGSFKIVAAIANGGTVMNDITIKSNEETKMNLKLNK
jgi:hypothetical protein